MPMTRAQFSQLMTPIYRTMFFKVFEELPEQYSLIYNVLNSTKNKEQDYEISGFKRMPIKNEGMNFDTDIVVGRYETVYTHLGFGLEFTVTKELMDDDLYDVIKKLPGSLGESAREGYENLAVSPLNNAFSTVMGDGVVLCSDSHPTVDAGTQSNLLSTSSDLTPTSLKAAIIQMKKMRDDRGLYLSLSPDLLVIPPDLEFDAYTILHSINQAGQANWDINAIRELYQLKPTILTRLTDTDAWWVLAKQRPHFQFFWRQRPDLEDDIDINSRDLTYNSMMRCSCGISVGGWRSIVGTPGV